MGGGLIVAMGAQDVSLQEILFKLSTEDTLISPKKHWVRI